MNNRNTTKRNTPFVSEIEFIENIRRENPEFGQYTLARQIENGEHGDGAYFRTYYSILSVIRRFDAKQAAARVPNHVMA